MHRIPQGGNIGVIGAYVGFCDHYNVSGMPVAQSIMMLPVADMARMILPPLHESMYVFTSQGCQK